MKSSPATPLCPQVRAEAEGFEPPRLLHLAAFKAASLGHSDTPPRTRLVDPVSTFRSVVGRFASSSPRRVPVRHHRCMSGLFEYFAASSDSEAAAAIELAGRASAAGMDVIAIAGVDPVVQLGTLEELLTGRSYDDITDDLRSGVTLAMRDGGETCVISVTDCLASALAATSDQHLAEVAVPWSETEEFWGQGDPEQLAVFLKALAALARRAVEANQQLYCLSST